MGESFVKTLINENFFITAFTETEKEVILEIENKTWTTTRINDRYECYSKDKVILLDSSEVNTYLIKVKDTGAILIDYTLYSLNGRNSSNKVEWWIRNGVLNYDYNSAKSIHHFISSLDNEIIVVYDGVTGVDEHTGI